MGGWIEGWTDGWVDRQQQPLGSVSGSGPPTSAHGSRSPHPRRPWAHLGASPHSPSVPTAPTQCPPPPEGHGNCLDSGPEGAQVSRLRLAEPPSRQQSPQVARPRWLATARIKGSEREKSKIKSPWKAAAPGRNMAAGRKADRRSPPSRRRGFRARTATRGGGRGGQPTEGCVCPKPCFPPPFF